MLRKMVLPYLMGLQAAKTEGWSDKSATSERAQLSRQVIRCLRQVSFMPARFCRCARFKRCAAYRVIFAPIWWLRPEVLRLFASRPLLGQITLARQTRLSFMQHYQVPSAEYNNYIDQVISLGLAEDYIAQLRASCSPNCPPSLRAAIDQACRHLSGLVDDLQPVPAGVHSLETWGQQNGCASLRNSSWLGSSHA